MNNHRFWIFAPLLAIGVTIGSVQAAPPAYILQLSVGSEEFDFELDDTDSNDTYTKATASVRSIVGLTRNSVVNLNADVFAQTFSDLDDKDNVGLLVEAIYSYVPTGGYTRPTYLFGLRHEIENYDDSGKDFGKTTLLLATALRLDDRITLTPGLEYSRKSLDNTDTDVGGVFVNADIKLTERVITYLNLKYQDEQSSSDTPATGARPTFIAGGHLPSEQPGFGLPGTSEIDSTNTLLVAGVNYAIDNHHTVDVSFEYADYALDDTGDTVATVISLDYFYKF